MSAPAWFRGVCAHRGASADEPENTRAALLAALEAGITLVECDVQLSRDGVPVVIHDATLERTTTLSGPVRARTAAEMGRADAGSWKRRDRAAEGVPTLAEFLALCAGRAQLLVELKPTFEAEPAVLDAVLQAVEAAGARERVALLAFDHRHLVAARERAPEVPRVANTATPPLDVVGLVMATGAAAIGPAFGIVDAALVDDAHAAGAAVMAWTVDDEGVAAALAARGVDVFVSNRPAEIARGLRR